MERRASIVGRLSVVCLGLAGVVALIAACDDFFVLPGDAGQTSVPFCTGAAFDVCGALAPPGCSSVPGCFEVGTCSGVAAFCFEYTFDANCRAAGCTWVDGAPGTPGSCVGGATPCSAYAGRDACIATGVCTFVASGSCVGTATCDGVDATHCLDVPGCSLGCPSPFVLCFGTCLPQEAAVASGCTSALLSPRESAPRARTR